MGEPADRSSPPAAAPAAPAPRAFSLAFSSSLTGHDAAVSLEALKAKPMAEWGLDELAFWLTHVSKGRFAEFATPFARLDGELFSPLTEDQVCKHCPGALGTALFNAKQDWLAQQGSVRPRCSALGRSDSPARSRRDRPLGRPGRPATDRGARSWSAVLPLFVVLRLQPGLRASFFSCWSLFRLFPSYRSPSVEVCSLIRQLGRPGAAPFS